MKELSIKEYISRIDFRHDDWKLSKIKEDMRKFLGEEPGVEIVYKKDVMINEVTGDAKEFLNINRIEVVFTDMDNSFKKLEFIIDDKI